ncbi:hypothetical protein NPS70_16230 [Streptomyces sp. C10-9-1]|uniref:hypothetical protein n=1 Tax=Streptomyces sp. C10-9-1 TaxID=1859285 RepID=UPI002110EF64|nr:hypothetical protein [Streptomyces sp. C10-9-1]MCQ6554734.1 hypothetical protein [Streptomyces sp. C10-9-1]
MKAFKILGTTDDVTTCDLCGRDELKGTVALMPLDVDGTEDGEVSYFGTSCAARAAGWTVREVAAGVKAANDAKRAEEWAERDATWEARHAAEVEFRTRWTVQHYGTADLDEAAKIAGVSPTRIIRMALEAQADEKAAPPATVAETVNIEPRGTVYGTRTHRQWSRVINGDVFRFELLGPSAYWKSGPTVRVTRHPYGRYQDETVVHERLELAAYAEGMEATKPCEGDRGHFVGRCAECDAAQMVTMSPERVEGLYHSGIFSQAKYEAFMHAWATSAVRYSAGPWAPQPTDPEVVAIVAAIRRHAGVPAPVGLAA